ncbi:tetratricopeptide repeat protein [Thioclava atlantica]|nr:SEL1-like repeat protein [Thioclava atlantica]
MRSDRVLVGGVILGAGLLFGTVGTSIAQDAGSAVAPAASQTAAPSADQRSARERGEAKIWGLDGEAKDPAAGVALLEQAVAEGDVSAMRTLGDILMWGGPVPADPQRGVTLLERAVKAGDGRARTILGKHLLGGWVIPRDAARGRELLEERVAADDPDAQTALSQFYLYGTGLPKDWTKARALAEAAAKAGKGEALWKFGEMLMWSERDPQAAQAALERAGELGEAGAWATLAEGAMYGFLGGRSTSRAKFAGYAAKARAAGNDRIEVLDAIRQMWGITLRASGPKTIERLTEAADAGNGEAAHYLVALLRDGNQLNIRKDRPAAQAALDKYKTLFTDGDYERYALSIEAARRRDPAGLAAMAERVQAEPGALSGDGAKQLYAANPNLAIYLIQQDLKKQGLYSGPLDGLAGKRTIRGMARVCRTLPGDLDCREKILSPSVVGAILTRE